MKYIFVFVVVLAVILVAITIGANNDQLISFNYVFAKSELQLSSLVALLFGFGFILGWVVTGFFYIKLKLKSMRLTRQIKRQLKQINDLEAAHHQVSE